MSLATPYNIFWEWLPTWLLAAEARTKKQLMGVAIKRLKFIEEGKVTEDGTPAGETGYLRNNEPFKALDDFVAHVYDGAEIPYWLQSAERSN